MTTQSPVFCAIDRPDLSGALLLARSLSNQSAGGQAIGGLKLGLEFVTANGPAGVRSVVDLGLPVFLDLKFHDIPNTVAGAIRGVMQTQPHIINVHTAGGFTMMQKAKQQAVESAKKLGVKCPLVIGVTILTALDEEDLKAVGYTTSVAEQVVKMAMLAKRAGLDGVVCSAHEIKSIKEACGDDFITVVPGIRPVGSSMDDQKRTMTPVEAIAAGADYIVIGRPITEATDVVQMAKDIAKSVNDI